MPAPFAQPIPVLTPEQERRFWALVNVDDSDKCWRFGNQTHAGYPMFALPRCRSAGAHRFMWELAHGRRIPTSHTIHHTCRNKGCVNPTHLEALTHLEHMARHFVEDGCPNTDRKWDPAVLFCFKGSAHA